MLKSNRYPSPWSLLLASLFLAGCANDRTQQAPPTERQAPVVPGGTATRVEVARIEAADAQLALRLPGEVEAWRDANLSAPLGGYIEGVFAEVGAKVKKGQLLARIDSATHGARLAQMKVELQQAERELARAKVMGEMIAKAELEAAESRVDAAKAAIRTQEVAVSRSVITAPFSGVIAQRNAEAGEVANPSVPLFRLVQLDPIKVTVSVPGRDVVGLERGMPARVSVDASSTRLEGRIERIQPAADLRTRAFVVEVKVEGADGRLMPGMIATVQVEGVRSEKRIIVPQDFLVTGLKEVGVFLADDGAARWRPVKLGPVVGNQVVVENGLEAGERIVVAGHRELAEGDPLLVAREGVCCKDGRIAFGKRP